MLGKAQARQDPSRAGPKGRYGRGGRLAQSQWRVHQVRYILTLGKGPAQCGKRGLNCCGTFLQEVSKLYASSIDCNLPIPMPLPRTRLLKGPSDLLWSLLQDFYDTVRDGAGKHPWVLCTPVIGVARCHLHSYILLQVPKLENSNPVFPKVRPLLP